MFKTSPVKAFVNLKVTKPNFQNNLPTRLLNGTKQELGKLSKRFLENIVAKVKKSSSLNQWKNTASVLQWFTKMDSKSRYSFIQWDIVNFYGSISEKLLNDALYWANTMIEITDDQ